MNQWILIHNQAPEFDKNVIVSVPGRNPYVTIASLSSVRESASGKQYEWDDLSDRSNVHNVSYWMPLPEPATVPEP